jgi:hypothetical protein
VGVPDGERREEVLPVGEGRPLKWPLIGVERRWAFQRVEGSVDEERGQKSLLAVAERPSQWSLVGERVERPVGEERG